MTGSCSQSCRCRADLAAIGRTVLASLLVAAAARGAPADAAGTGADWPLTLQARNALWDDPLLAKLNLGVRVREGIAILHGPVPSQEVAEMAVGRLRRVPGVRGVLNETYPPPVDDPVARSQPRPMTSHRSPAATAT